MQAFCALFSCLGVTAENDFLHSLLEARVTTSKGDSGGQGTVPAGQQAGPDFQLGLSLGSIATSSNP